MLKKEIVSYDQKGGITAETVHFTSTSHNSSKKQKSVWANPWFKYIMALIAAISAPVIVYFLTTNRDMSDIFKVISNNQTGGITAGKVEINNFNEPPKIPYEENFYYKYYQSPKIYGGKNIIEIRPKQGVWYPVIMGIPMEEKGAVDLSVVYGPAGQPPIMSQTATTITKSDDDKWFVIIGNQQATPEQSYYIVYKNDPSVIIFGPQKDNRRYHLNPAEISKD